MKTIYPLDDLSRYDDTELSLVAEFTLPDGTKSCEMLSTIDFDDINRADYSDAVFFYSVYAHLKTGGVECAGDFDSLDDAQIYCHALDALLKG